MYTQDKIRNIAIIAHIDHGKTTLLDSLLKQSMTFSDHEKIPERVMDSYDQERERGITIFAKNTSIYYQDYKINIVDTPGHADFAGEVERVLGMVNSVLLLVDAKEGPMPQTRYVLMKALQMGLNPLVVLNKIDRPGADAEKTLNLTFDLFVELGATDEQLDFSYCYASGLNGFAYLNEHEPKKDLKDLFDLIVAKVPVPKGDPEAPFLLQTATIDYDSYIGRQACGRILNGKVEKGMDIQCVKLNGEKVKFRVQRIEGHHGLKKVEILEAGVGDIVIISGMEDVMIGDLICSENNTFTPPPISIEEPTLSIDIRVNSGPFAGKEGKNLTMNKIRDRLLKEKRANVTLRIEAPEGVIDKITVSGRGELHLAVLIEAMRRESFEFLVSKPKVILKTIDGVIHEPIEMAFINVPEEYAGAVIQELGTRRGEVQSLHTNDKHLTSIEFLIPTRGLIGCFSELLTLTRGLAMMTSNYHSYAPWKGVIPGRKRGVLISMCRGTANAFACFSLQKRGTLFVQHGDEVYEGMIVGENSRENDLVVNVTKAKQLSNVRSPMKDENIIITPPRTFTLEEGINFIEDDEFVEITPLTHRLRKQILSELERRQSERKSASSS